MSKSTRIFELVHLLGGRRSRTVTEIAEKLEISERTAFRYLADLQAQHIPIYKDDHGYRLLESIEDLARAVLVRPEDVGALIDE